MHLHYLAAMVLCWGILTATAFSAYGQMAVPPPPIPGPPPKMTTKKQCMSACNQAAERCDVEMMRQDCTKQVQICRKGCDTYKEQSG